jgi:DNA-binding transcriptional ArsR family regulator
MTDHTDIPDYEIDDVLELTTPEQFQAMAGAVRPRILGLLRQRALSTQQIAVLLGMPKGTAGHHLKVLESAGLIHVIRTRQVRAVTEKYYGRVARLHRIAPDWRAPGTRDRPSAREIGGSLLRQASSELVAPSTPDDPSSIVLVHARLSESQARRFAQRLEALSQEFAENDAAGDRVYGFVGGVYLTDWPDVAGCAADGDE